MSLWLSGTNGVAGSVRAKHADLADPHEAVEGVLNIWTSLATPLAAIDETSTE